MVFLHVLNFLVVQHNICLYCLIFEAVKITLRLLAVCNLCFLTCFNRVAVSGSSKKPQTMTEYVQFVTYNILFVFVPHTTCPHCDFCQGGYVLPSVCMFVSLSVC